MRQGEAAKTIPISVALPPIWRTANAMAKNEKAVTNGRATLAQPQEPEVSFLEPCEVGPETAEGAAHGPRILEVG